MDDIFLTPDQIAQQMLDDYKAITGIELSINDLGREEVVKIRNYSVAFSMERAELQRIEDNIFPQSSTTEGLIAHLAARQLPARASAQRANGLATFVITAVPVDIPLGTVFKKDLDGKLYRTTEAFLTSDPAAIGNKILNAESVDTGQAQNIEADDGVTFKLASPIPNVDDAVESASQFRDGRDQETPEEMLERIQTHDRRRDTGGNLVAYERFAREASAQVVTAKALDEPRGPGTVDVVITSGTTDIRQAVENGEAITRLPSTALVNEVQAYVEQQNPTTDDVEVIAPTEEAFDVTYTYDLYDESLRPSVDADVRKEIDIYIYTATPNQVLHPTELERLIDARVGHLIKARRASNFDGGNVAYTVPNDKILSRGTITTQAFA